MKVWIKGECIELKEEDRIGDDIYRLDEDSILVIERPMVLNDEPIDLVQLHRTMRALGHAQKHVEPFPSVFDHRLPQSPIFYERMWTE